MSSTSPKKERMEGDPLCHDMALAHDTFFMLKDMREAEHKYLTGRLLTFVESLFDAGSRCEAVKSAIRDIVFEFRTRAEDNSRTLGYELAGALGDLTMQEDMRLNWGATPHWKGLPRLSPSVLGPDEGTFEEEKTTETTVTVESDDPKEAAEIAKKVLKDLE